MGCTISGSQQTSVDDKLLYIKFPWIQNYGENQHLWTQNQHLWKQYFLESRFKVKANISGHKIFWSETHLAVNKHLWMFITYTNLIPTSWSCRAGQALETSRHISYKCAISYKICTKLAVVHHSHLPVLSYCVKLKLLD